MTQNKEPLSNTAHRYKFGLVSLVGRTNVGKSTLLNRIIGEKISIISPKVQTTRASIRGIKTTDLAQIIFLDTPGFFLNPRTKLDQKLASSAREGLLQVDLILFMIIPQEAMSDENVTIIKEIRDSKIPAILLINKIDTIQREKLLPIMAEYSRKNLFLDIYPISALHGDNVEALENGIVSQLPEGELHYDPEIVSTANLRFICSEIIREKVYEFTHQEIPYAAAIRIENFVESESLTRIEATIYVEKESQKGIVIGHKAEMIKRIGTNARQEIEQLLESQVFLDLRVKVKKKWRSNEQFLKQLGL